MLTTQQLELWERLLAFEVDAPGTRFTFDKRLARENGWSLGFARQVVFEYKRFVLLCMEAGHVCTPSETVDQAWHLHLAYTQSYWERLCGEVLRRPLHHNPTAGGKAESDKFEDLYARTLESYERMFGEAPPADIWPSGSERFGHDLDWVRVNRHDFLLVPRKTVQRIKIAGGCVAAGLAAAGCFEQVGGEDTIGLLFLILAGLGAVALYRRKQRSQRALTPSQRRNLPQRDSNGQIVYVDGVPVAGCAGMASGTDSGSGTGSDAGGGCSGGGDGGGGCGGGGCGGGGCGGG